MPRTPALSLISLSLVAVTLGLCVSCSHSVSAAASPDVTSQPPAAALVQPFIHTVKRGESFPGLLRQYLSHTPYMTLPELEAATREANHFAAGAVKPGQQLIIPQYDAAPWIEHSVLMARDEEVRAIYLTGLMAGSEHGIRLIQRWHDLGGNSVVFDIKDSDGLTSVAFDHPLAPKIHHPYISNLPKFIRFLHGMNMHAIARIALFRDEHLVTNHPELAVQSASALKAADGKGPQPWRENGKLVWTDTSNTAVQDYNLELAKFVAASGADEIQFDYVRFPAEGNQADARFAYMSAPRECGAAKDTAPATAACAARTRADVISDFLARTYRELHPSGVLLSLDVFGVMAWQRPVDLSHTGQDIVRMARSCDVLSPMIYPSHFFGMDGYAQPGDAPEHFISTSLQRFEKITHDSGVVVRPWLQAFAWRTKTYSPQYIETQVRVARENGGIGFLFWNARNDYGRPFAAMPQMRADAARYLQAQSARKPVQAAAASSGAGR